MALSDLYALIPEQGYILGADLPSVFSKYEKQRGTVLLQPSEREALERFGREHAAERVDAEVLIGLIGQLLGAAGMDDNDPTRSDGDSEGKERGIEPIGGVESGRVTKTPFKGLALPLADTANMSLLDDTEPPFTPVAADRSNPHEDGIAVSGRAPDTDVEKKTSPETAPGKSTAKPSTPATTSHIPRRREKPISSPAAPPSSYTPVQRGARRGSDPATTPNQTPMTKPAVRSSSALSNHSYGSASSGIVRPRPPRTSTSSRRSTSPSQVMASSRHTVRKSSTSTTRPSDPFHDSPPMVPGSPDLPALASAYPELSMLDETSFVGRGVGDVSVNEDEDEIGGRHGSRLDRISTASTSSLAATHDALQALKRENSDLLKKKNELARQLQVIGAETEAQLADLQESLDGARAELAAKRKEEKESRTREAQLGTQICTLELEMQHLQQQLSTARESHGMQQRMLQDANAEADRLRDALLGKEEDVAGLKVTIETYEDEKRSWEDQLQTLQATNATLQASLHTAQEAARTLERRKAENQELQQTIKRLTHELDILRTQQNAGARHVREETNASAPASMAARESGGRMSLGDELRSHFAVDGEESEEEKGGKSRTVVRTVTYRTERVVRHRDKEATGDTSESEPETSLVEEIVREYVDVGVETDSPVSAPMASASIQTDETHHGVLPPYSPRSDPEIVREALTHAHPALELREKVNLEQHRELAMDYARVSSAVGMRCTLIEEKLNAEQGEALRVRTEPVFHGNVSSGVSLKWLLYMCAAAVAMGVAGYYLGWRRNQFQLLDGVRKVLQDHLLPYVHLYLQEFIPSTTRTATLAGGVKLFVGRTPI